MPNILDNKILSYDCNLRHKKLFANCKLEALAFVFSNLEGASILGCNPSSRYSFFAAEPTEIFQPDNSRDIFIQLRKILDKYRISDAGVFDDIPAGVFTGGWLGFFSYDLGSCIEKITPPSVDDLSLPLIRLAFYDSTICFDSLRNEIHLFAIDFGNGGQDKIAQLEKILQQAEETEFVLDLQGSRNFDISKFRSNMTKQYYFDSFARIKEHIRCGDVYQVNFSQRFSALFDMADSFKLFCWQNRFNPSPFSAYIDADEFKIVSASPEMFIKISDSSITTCPIKGTRSRSGNSGIDLHSVSELVSNAKERAELDMIIDLQRNDLGRICKPGSITVPQRRRIERFDTVFHAVAEIAGHLRTDIDFVTILKAVFPGGSITGAPKIAAGNIINRLEPTARGLYTGSIGWLDLRQNAHLNIAIRTIIIKQNAAYVQAGGGIVADSQMQFEFDETMLKAKALLTGIEAI